MNLRLPHVPLNERNFALVMRLIEDWANQVSVSPEALVGFTIQNLAASQTAAKLWNGYAFPATGASGDLLGRQTGITMPWAGSIIAMSLTGSVAKAAGTAAFEAYVTGTASGAILNWGNNDHDYTNFDRESFGFAAGDVLDVRVTTNGAFSPVTSEVAVSLFCLRQP